MYAGLKIVAVVPAYNEEKLIARTIATLPHYVDCIVLVDDCSVDDTVENACEVGDERLIVVRHTKNNGVGAAISTGYTQALALGADVAVVLAGDGQMDPSELASLVEPIANNEADYVKGNRLGHPELTQRMPFSRLIGNWGLTLLTRFVTQSPGLTDSQCGYTAISRRALLAVPLDQLWPRYGYPNDLLSHLRCVRMRVAERPVTPIYGAELSGIRPFADLPLIGYVLARSWVRCQRAR